MGIMIRNHRVQIPLLTSDVFMLKDRVNEIVTIKDWVFNLCDYDEDRYEMKVRINVNILDIWFRDEKDAIMCALRWMA
jgi:hypothetical protein